MKRIKKVLGTVIPMIMLIIGIFPSHMGYSSEPHDANAMWVEPSRVDLSTDTYTVGYKFNVTVWLNITSCGTGSYICGWQFVILYNKAHLNATRCGYAEGIAAGKSQFFELLTMTMPVTPIFESYNDTHNYVVHGESWLMGPKQGPPRVGKLSWVEFEVVAAPPDGEVYTSIIDISTRYMTTPPETKVLNDKATRITFTPYNCIYRFSSPSAPPEYTLQIAVSPSLGGTTDPAPDTYFYDESETVTVTGYPNSGWEIHYWTLDGSNVGTANSVNVYMDTDHELICYFEEISVPPGESRLYVDPPEIIAPTMLPCSTFAINVTIDDVADLTVCEFNLTYISVILGWMGINILKVQNQVPTTAMMVDDEAGFIWVKLTYSTPVTTEDPIPLVTIHFHVEALGVSPLDLHDTHLTDSEGDPIPHEAEDGLFVAQIHDVAITNVVPSSDWVYQDWEVNITVTAKNKGDVNETFVVTAKYDDSQIGNFTVEDIPPGNETTILFIWNTKNVTACCNYTISAEASIVPYELNITDNEYIDGKVEVRIMGDINSDGIVDMSDILVAALAYGSQPDDPDWNPEADINGDGIVDIEDIFWIAANFGKSCSS